MQKQGHADRSGAVEGRAEHNQITYNVLAIFGYKNVPSDIKPIAPRSLRFKRDEVRRFIMRFDSGGASWISAK
jgi:hypothetical protein